jgi:hypothetical protein
MLSALSQHAAHAPHHDTARTCRAALLPAVRALLLSSPMSTYSMAMLASWWPISCTTSKGRPVPAAPAAAAVQNNVSAARNRNRYASAGVHKVFLEEPQRDAQWLLLQLPQVPIQQRNRSAKKGG